MRYWVVILPLLGACATEPPTGNTVPVAANAPCPDWREHDSTQKWRNQPSPGFGCTTAANLAAMVDQPADIQHGRTPGPALAALQLAPIGTAGKAALPAAAATGNSAQPR